jgi:hypothetical protein
MTVGRQPAGVVSFNGVPFFLMKNQQGVPDWHPRQTATQEGDPTTPARTPYADWSRGLGDSRGAFKGSVEFCTNAFLGRAGRILPGHKITEIATGHNAAVTAILEVTAPASRIISFGGQYGKEIDPSTQLVTATKDFGGGATVTDAMLWGTRVAIAMGASVDFQTRDSAGTYAANTISRKATCFGLGTNGDLVKGLGATWSRCSVANFYGVDNWGAELSIGDPSYNVRRVGSQGRWDIILKDEGFYSFEDTQSDEINMLGDLRQFHSSENQGWFQWYDRVMLCTRAGLYRVIQNGPARTVGTEELPFNESVLAGCWPTAGVGFGRYAYVAFYNGTTTYLCMMRNALNGDANNGSPFTIDSIIDSFTGDCRAMLLSSASGALCLYYGAKNGANYTVRWCKVSTDGTPVDYRDSGTSVVDWAPSDLGSPLTVKYFRSLEVIARNPAYQFAAKVDGGSWNNVGAAVNAVSATFGQAFWTLASNDHGRVLQLRSTASLSSPSAPPEIRNLIVSYDERPVMVEGAMFTLGFEDNASDGHIENRMTAYDQRQFIQNLLDGAPFTFEDAYGQEYTAAMNEWHSYRNTGSDPLYQTQSSQSMTDQILLVVRRLDYA